MSWNDLWSMTPRQIAGVQFFSSRMDRHEAAATLALHSSAARGDPKKLKKQIDKLQKD